MGEIEIRRARAEEAPAISAHGAADRSGKGVMMRTIPLRNSRVRHA